jgi:hypothetical protein
VNVPDIETPVIMSMTGTIDGAMSLVYLFADVTPIDDTTTFKWEHVDYPATISADTNPATLAFPATSCSNTYRFTATNYGCSATDIITMQVESYDLDVKKNIVT